MTERALVVYIGDAFEANFRIGIDLGIWGFKAFRREYNTLEEGDLIVFGVKASGGPRTSPEEWRQRTLSEVVVGQLAGASYEDSTHVWPDEGPGVSYSFRVDFEVLTRDVDVNLGSGSLGPEVVEGLRNAGSGGQGVVVLAGGSLLEPYLLPEAPASSERSAENVWLEIQYKCREHMASGTPILTLDRGIPNLILAVEDDKIRRRSATPRSGSGGDSSASPTKSGITRLWNRLVQNGEVGKDHALAFTKALLGRLIEGVGYSPDPFRLYFTDRARAMKAFNPPYSLPDTRVLDLIGAIKRSPQPSGPALHNPFLLLLALARLQSGQPRLAAFSEYEQPLSDLLQEFGPPAERVAPELPFWHLQNDSLWVVIGDDDQALLEPGTSLGDPPMALLRSRTTRGGLPDDVFELLTSDKLLFNAAVQLLLEEVLGALQLREEEGLEVEHNIVEKLGINLIAEADVDYRQYALTRITAAIGFEPTQQEPRKQTFLLPSGQRFHLRTQRGYRRPGGSRSYRFGIQEDLWTDDDIFVLQCGLAGTLIVPIAEWLPFKDKIPLSMAGTGQVNRQPTLWRLGRNFELRVPDQPNTTTGPELRHDARRWLDRFDVLERSGPAEAGDAPMFWWVNQGSSYRSERDGGYLFAPKTTRSGQVISMHSNMVRMKPGQTTFHYAQGAVRAISVVRDAAVEVESPPERSAENGYLVRSTYYELAEAIQLNDIPIGERLSEGGPFNRSGGVKQGYLFPLSDEFGKMLREMFSDRWPAGSPFESEVIPYRTPVERAFPEIVGVLLSTGLLIDEQTLRRYHISLRTHGFVVLTGLSGTGKTWLASAYADAVEAESLIVPVAPNWTTNEDLLGYFNPLDNTYHDTEFSRFMRDAANEYAAAKARRVPSKQFHLILDEMNLARVEYYFAKFLSAMEERARNGTASVTLAPGEEVTLAPNLLFIGTVNVDETTHAFADKVNDRAQLIELTVSRAMLDEFIGAVPWRDTLLAVWTALTPSDVAPFAFRVVDEIRRYIAEAGELDVEWKTALDEQLLQKVLPKVRGVEPRVGSGLEDLLLICDEGYPLTRAKVEQMLWSFKQHGFASYF